MEDQKFIELLEEQVDGPRAAPPTNFQFKQTMTAPTGLQQPQVTNPGPLSGSGTTAATGMLDPSISIAPSATINPVPPLPTQSVRAAPPVYSDAVRDSSSSSGSLTQQWWWSKGICGSAARAIAGSLVVAIVLVIMRPEAVLKRPKKGDGKRTRNRYRRVNYGSVCILSTLTGILATCMFGG